MRRCDGAPRALMLGLASLAALCAACAEHAGGAGPATPVSADACSAGPCRPARSIVLQSRKGQVIVNAPPSRYVINDSVIVRAGDDFFVAADEKDGMLVNLRKVDGPSDAPNVLHLSFKQQQVGTGDFVMLLMIDEKVSRPLVYRAIARLPNGRMFASSTCPIHAGVTATEMWPDPIWILLLDHFRVADDARTCKIQS